MSNEDIEALEFLQEFAKNNCDGHFCLFKFTTNWRCCLRTPNFGRDIDQFYEQIKQLPSGKSIAEAVVQAIIQFLNPIPPAPAPIPEPTPEPEATIEELEILLNVLKFRRDHNVK